MLGYEECNGRGYLESKKGNLFDFSKNILTNAGGCYILPNTVFVQFDTVIIQSGTAIRFLYT